MISLSLPGFSALSPPKPKATIAPVAVTPDPVPVADDKAVGARKRRTASLDAKTGGQLSTVLSGNTARLGG